MPISTIGSIKDVFGHYGEITLSDITYQAEIINAVNGSMEQEYDNLYTCLMA